MFQVQIDENLSGQRLSKALSRILKEAPGSFLYKMLRKKNITLNGHKADGSEQVTAGDTLQFFFSQETYDKMRGLSLPAEGKEEAVQKLKEPEKTGGKSIRQLKEPEITRDITGGKQAERHREKPENQRAEDFDFGISVLYEDRDVCVFVKPAGLLSQKAQKTDLSANDWVLQEAARKGYYKADGKDYFTPSVVNRLDRNTSGIMLAGLSLKGSQELSSMIRDHKIRKFYYAIVRGKAPEQEELFAYLYKNEKTNQVRVEEKPFPGSDPIHTAFRRLYYDPGQELSLLEVELFTGKTHQIRAHLAFLGFPILGDPKYGDQKLNRSFGIRDQALCAHKLEFPLCGLPGLSNKTFSIPTPETWPLKDSQGNNL